jgi:hypothetical protein
MKRISDILIFGIGLMIILGSCRKDEIAQTVESSIVTTLDTNLYPGNFRDYVAPTFAQNTNSERNALIEEFTGHYCGHCPRAHEKGLELETNNPGRVFVTAIHASPDWDGSSVLNHANDTGAFSRDFRTTEGRAIAAKFYGLGVGFFGLPQGTVNRQYEGPNFVYSYSSWEDRMNEVLSSELEVNLQAKSNFFPSTKGVYLHVETEFIKELSGDYNITVYAVQDQIIDWQRDYLYSPNSDLEFYEHHNVHIGNIFGESWGREVGSGNIPQGTKSVTDFSYEIPEGLSKDEMHFIIYIYNRDTYEVKQVIDHHL